jgi:hypothetical protein
MFQNNENENDSSNKFVKSSNTNKENEELSDNFLKKHPQHARLKQLKYF